MNNSIEMIARVAHEINRAYCAAIGDNSQPTWEDAPQWQKDTIINGVIFHLNNPDATPSASHESWLKKKEEEGWKYGPVKNPETKEHPCFVPYEQLPVEQRVKDYLFKQVVDSLRNGLSTISPRAAQIMNVSFNPGGREDVQAIKVKCAELWDVIADTTLAARVVDKEGMTSDEQALRRNDIMRLESIAKTHLETAQMFAVKAVTR